MNTVIALANNVIRELYRRKDFYVLLILIVAITLLMGSATFFEEDKIVRGLQEICLLLIWIAALVMAVGTAARQIPAEKENRTIFPLLAKPVTRAHIIVGKFLGCWLASGIALVLFYLFFTVISFSREHQLHLLIDFQAMWQQWIFLAMVIALVLWGSIIFAAPSSNATICVILVLALQFVSKDLGIIAMQQKDPLQWIIYAIYFIVPHTEFFDMREQVVQHGQIVPWHYIILATLYGLSYTSVFLFAAWLSFRRKTLTT
jgi:ABC-type transport system involved in multi-copper enzyme maturation permease subunit